MLKKRLLFSPLFSIVPGPTLFGSDVLEVVGLAEFFGYIVLPRTWVCFILVQLCFDIALQLASLLDDGVLDFGVLFHKTLDSVRVGLEHIA